MAVASVGELVDMNAMERVAEIIKSRISATIQSVKPVLPDYIHKIKTISVNDLKKLAPVEGKNMLFVDGGNAEIIHAPNFSVSINRVYGCTYRGSEKLAWTRRVEFYSVMYTEYTKISGNADIFYKTVLIPLKRNDINVRAYLPDEKDLEIESSSVGLKTAIGTKSGAKLLLTGISRVAWFPRKYAEWAFARKVIEEFDDDLDMVVMDGPLQALYYRSERDYLNRLIETANEKGIYLVGVSKTCELYDHSGNSLIGQLLSMAESLQYERWYVPIAIAEKDFHRALILVAKLHPYAERIYRIDIALNNEFNIKEFEDINGAIEQKIATVLGSLAANAMDVTLPGYPYGLIDADNFARIRSREKEIYITWVTAGLLEHGVNLADIERHMRASDTHELLNIIV